jgi:hypothetical protein
MAGHGGSHSLPTSGQYYLLTVPIIVANIERVNLENDLQVAYVLE